MRRLALLSLAVLLAGCGGDRGGSADTGGTDSGLSGRIQVDGSSTVAPYATAAAEGFRGGNPGVDITVGVSGTGGGFERFCRGETDISDASRTIEDDEAAACKEKGIDDVEIQVANDALTVVVNPENDWADCLTVAQLKTIWDSGSKVKSWQDVDPSFPDVDVEALRAGDRLRNVRLLHQGDQRRGRPEPLGLRGERGRQRDRPGRQR